MNRTTLYLPLIFILFTIGCTNPNASTTTEPGQPARGPKNGEWIARRDDGTIKTRVNYKDGIKDGYSYLFYKDGKTVQLKIPYAAGDREGTSVKYFEDGSVYAETSYSNDLLNGQRKTFYRNGQLKSSITYQNGLPGSDLNEFFKSGNMKPLPEIIYTAVKNGLILSLNVECQDLRFFFGGMNPDDFFEENTAVEELLRDKGQFIIDLKKYTPSYLRLQDIVCTCKSSQGNPIVAVSRIDL